MEEDEDERENWDFTMESPQRRPPAPEYPLRELYSAPGARYLLTHAHEDRYHLRQPSAPWSRDEMGPYFRRMRDIEEAERRMRLEFSAGPSLLRYDPLYERYAEERREFMERRS
ncbi:hypothetical protein GOP47_0011891 [Adiantum capillus-veneris]|uniref:Uncharacterized protein n=1 Tax=Adiantum capillus-veneris TaxID=13818 RepID=A0A9D4UUV7_ADICA|nr:hypothetical protein GOP47_0011891 [Adiantum capillus-veneris]